MMPSDETVEDPAGAAEWPKRRVSDPAVLRAMAHPLRLRLMELLAVHGPATATELAARTDQKPANCSWHLRQLAAAGFIEEAGGGTGRQRHWRYIPTGHVYSTSGTEPEFLRAARTVSAAQLDRELGELRSWTAHSSDEPDEWRSAAFMTQSILWLTPEELTELGDTVTALYLRSVRRMSDPESRPKGARPIRLIGWGVPAVNLEDAPPDPGDA